MTAKTKSGTTSRAEAAGEDARGFVAGLRDAHGSATTKIFGRARSLLGPVATPLELAHDVVLSGTYSSLGLALDVTGVVARPAAGFVAGQVPSRVVKRRATSVAAFVQGFTGDRLVDVGLPISYPMTLRRSGYDVPITKAGLSNAYPDASSNLVVFVHGFVGTEQMWKRRASRDDEGRRLSYGRRLESLGDWSAVWVRYNTGQRVSTNGRDLGRMLARLVARWPVPVDRVVLVGHSMGGLVVHSALLQAAPDAPWAGLVTDTVSFGTPYHGALLEKSVNVVAKEFDNHRATRWAGGVLRFRSQGIKDLRHGNLVEADWKGFDPDDPEDHRARDRKHLHPIRHLAVVGMIAPQPHAWWGRPLGDGVVSRSSAAGLEGETWDTAYVGGVNHMDLLNHPKVYNVLAERLGVEQLPLRHPGD
ncbi:hypothetical protein GCM10027599_17090 [Yimella radicis]